MDRVLLYSLISNKIRITIQAYFDGDGNLVIDGHDLGTTVEEVFGDSEYEYSTTIRRDHVDKLCVALGLPIGVRDELLALLKSRYNDNTCYRQIQSFLAEHDIPFEKFSWM